MAYPVLDARLTADVLERELLARWRSEGLFHRVTAATRGGPPFVFFEGPPTANGRPGIHHVFARTIKDLICRFQAMQGRSVTRKAGWDTHGLPVEIEIEKQLKISGKISAALRRAALTLTLSQIRERVVAEAGRRLLRWALRLL